jgi:hypothetical protein
MVARFIGKSQGKVGRELPADRFEGVEWRVFLTDEHYNDCVVAVAAMVLARRTARWLSEATHHEVEEGE